jgi:uncharacterized protein (TIGR03437 family)
MIRISRVVAALFAVLPMCGQPSLGPQQFIQDLEAVVAQLPKLHVNLFFQTPQADFNAAAQQLQADIPNLSQYQFYTRLSMLIAMARDGHTSLELSASAGFPHLPITLQHFSDGYFVTSAPTDRSVLNRAKLLAVGAASLDQVLTALAPVISHENNYWFWAVAAQSVANLGIMRGLGFLPDTGPAMYTFRLDSGEQVSVDLASSGPVQAPALDPPGGFIPPLESSNENYWSAYWPQTKTVYLRVASFHASDGGQQVASQTLAYLDGMPVDNLVFDLRDDAGGDLTVLFPLLHGLTQRLKTLQFNARFQVFALINGGSYSSASILAMILKAGVPDFLAPFAPGIGAIPTTLVGEPSGGPPLTHGNPETFTLPASRMLVQYSTVYSPPFPGIPDRDAIYPDVASPVQSTDYFARHDAILASVLARAGAAPAPPTGGAIVVNSASFRTGTGIAPGSFASAFGSFPGGDLNVLVNGEAAKLVAATASQLVFVIPADASIGPAALDVRQSGHSVSSGAFQITGAGPGLFVAAPLSAQPGAILNQDGQLNTSGAPAARGSVLQVFGTGYGPLDAVGHAVTGAWIADIPATVLYSGPAPGIPGLWQINVQVPDTPVVAGEVPLFVSAPGLVSNGVTIRVQP